MIDAGLLAQIDRVQVERRLEFAGLPAGWAAVAMVVAAVALCWLIVRLYRREARAGASQRVRVIMASVRCLVVLCLFAIWLRPVLATYLHRWIDSYTLVLVDTSSSMDLQDRYRTADEIARVKPVMPQAGTEAVRRTDVIDKVLGGDSDRFLRDLTKNNRVKLYTFSDVPKVAYTLQAQRESRYAPATSDDEKNDAQYPLPANDVERAQTRFSATGAVTDLGRAVRQAIESLGRSPLAGVVLLTDGGLNTGDSAETIARYARDRGVALQVIGIGDASPPRNVRVAEVIAPDNVFSQDPFAVVAQIVGQGMTGETVPVELVERRAGDDQDRIVATKSVTIERDNVVEPITFNHQQDGVGRYVYRVQIPVGETESVADDNTRQTVVNVIENRLRVLIVAGSPSWEYRYVSRLLQRDDTFELSCWLQSADTNAVRDGNIVIDHLPATAEELFKYDAVILLDPDPLELTADWSQLLSEMVTEHGGGVLYEAARMYTPSFMNDAGCAPIVRMLPVTIDPDAELVLNDIGHFQRQEYSVVIPPTAAGHPIVQRPTEGAGSGIGWSQMGGVFWHYPVLREKPVATVLMRHGNPRMQNAYGRHVLLATQYVGSGRTAFLGFDGTWRWRAFGEDVFNRFWIQLIRHLVEGKLTGGNRRGMVLTESDSYQLGEAIRVTARLFDASFKPLQSDSVEAQYRIGDQIGKFTLSRVDERPGWYEGRFVPPQTGSCEITLPIPGDLNSEVARREIQIVRPNLEIVQPQLDRELLVGLAEQSAGGSYYDVRDAMQVPEVIPDRHESTTIRSRPAPLWDDTWVLILLVGLLSTEWAMRKIFKLL